MTIFPGNFVVPNVNNGIVSLWPGLQGGEDVLQAELTGQFVLLLSPHVPNTHFSQIGQMEPAK